MADGMIILPDALPGSNRFLVLRIIEGATGYFGLSFDYSDTPTYPSSGVVAQGTNTIGPLTTVSGVIDATYDVDRFLWTCFTPVQVVDIAFQQSVIENTSATTTVMPQKVPTGVAIAGATAKNLLTAAVNLKTGVVANTVLRPTLTATVADLQFAAGDSLGLDFTNALTEYIGCMTVTFKLIT